MALVLSNTSEPNSGSAAGLAVLNNKLAREVAELVKDTESPLLFHHSSRVYYWGALTGERWGLRLDPELLYAGAMFHDMGLVLADKDPSFRPENFCRVIRALCLARLGTTRTPSTIQPKENSSCQQRSASPTKPARRSPTTPIS